MDRAQPMKALLRDLDELGQMTFQRHQAGEPLSPIEEWPDIEGAERCADGFQRMADLLRDEKCPYCGVALDYAGHRCNSHER